MGHVNRPADSWADTSGAPPTALLCGNEAQAPGPAPPPLHAPTWSISVLFNNFRIKSPFSAVGWVTMGRGWKPHLGPQIATEPSWVASRNPGLVTVQTWLQGPGLARRHQLRGSAAQSWCSSAGHGSPQALASPASVETQAAARPAGSGSLPPGHLGMGGGGCWEDLWGEKHHYSPFIGEAGHTLGVPPLQA